MKYFTWIIASGNEQWLASKSLLSKSYLFPSKDDCLAASLAGSFVFVILRGGRGDILSRQLLVQSVEKINEDGEFNGYMLNINMLSSFALTSQYSSANDSCILGKNIHLPLGMSEIDGNVLDEILRKIRENISIRLKKPSLEDLPFIKTLKVSSPSAAGVSVLLKTVIQQFPLDNIWGSRELTNPFVNFTFEYLKHLNAPMLEDWKTILKRYCSLPLEKKTIGLTYPSDATPEVDINFEPVNPEHILTRTFVARDEDTASQGSLDKTENAEKRHQEILREISIYLAKIGITPLQSTSVDLAIGVNSSYVFFEIKTTHAQNAVAQSGKGAFQLAIYTQAAVQAGLEVKGRFLIIEPINPDFNAFIEKSLHILGISLLFFDKHAQWPNKLSDIHGIPFDFGRL